MLVGFTVKAQSALVLLETIDPTILIDIKYATANNFTGVALYPAARCYVRRAVGEALAQVQSELRSQGMGLKVFDAYRPLSIQRKLWASIPDERYVAHPDKGSNHNRGAAVDLTLVNEQGVEFEMPSYYDEFSPRAHRNYRECSRQARENRALLEAVMARHGFLPFPTEWWHFDHKDWKRFPLEDMPLIN